MKKQPIRSGVNDINGREIIEGLPAKDVWGNTGLIGFGDFILDGDFHYWTVGFYFKYYDEEEDRYYKHGIYTNGTEEDPKVSVVII